MSTTEVEEQLKRNLRADVREFFTEYAYCVDERRWGDFAQLFTDDSKIFYDNRILGIPVGNKGDKAKILSWLKNVFKFHGKSQHFISNVYVRFPENVKEKELLDKKTLVLNATAQIVNTQNALFFNYQSIGRYDHELVFINGRWRSRKLHEKDQCMIPAFTVDWIIVGAALAGLGFKLLSK